MKSSGPGVQTPDLPTIVHSPKAIQLQPQLFRENQMDDLTFKAMREANATRVKRWHIDGINEWSGLEWAGAMCGEAGEAANVAKKIRRLEIGVPSIKSGGLSSDQLDELKHKLAKEAADTLLYLDLMCHRYDLDLAAAVIEVFNTKSEEYGFPERL